MTSNIFVELHVLTQLPFSNANRDRNGLPKSTETLLGSRGRQSSASWKRAARERGMEHTEILDQGADAFVGGYSRTRNVYELIAEELVRRYTEDGLPVHATGTVEIVYVLKNAKASKDQSKGAFLSSDFSTPSVVTEAEVNYWADELYDFFKEHYASGKKFPAKLESPQSSYLYSAMPSVAEYGRFFAEQREYSVDGAAQVAHPITVHNVDIQAEMHVAVDDAAGIFGDHAGGHLGESYYVDGTFYKYANMDMTQFAANLASVRREKKVVVREGVSRESLAKALEARLGAWLEDMALAVPNGKVRSTAHITPPEHVRITVSDCPMNLSTAAYGKPVSASEARKDGVTAASVARLDTAVAASKRMRRKFREYVLDDDESLFDFIDKVLKAEFEAGSDVSAILDRVEALPIADKG